MVIHLSPLFVLLAAHFVLVFAQFATLLVLVVALFALLCVVVASPLFVFAVLATLIFRSWLRAQHGRGPDAKKQGGDPDDGLHGELLGSGGPS
jgi:membrane protein implicated in regulation of membrane protease activity